MEWTENWRVLVPGDTVPANLLNVTMRQQLVNIFVCLWLETRKADGT